MVNRRHVILIPENHRENQYRFKLAVLTMFSALIPMDTTEILQTDAKSQSPKLDHKISQPGPTMNSTICPPTICILM